MFHTMHQNLARRTFERIHSVRICLLMVFTTVLFNLAACQNSPEAKNGYAPSDESISVSAKPDIVAGTPVKVKITETGIEMPAAIAPGTTTFTITNSTTTERTFRIEGVGVDKALGASLKPGESGTLPVDLLPGSYKITCPTSDNADPAASLQLELVVNQKSSNE